MLPAWCSEQNMSSDEARAELEESEAEYVGEEVSSELGSLTQTRQRRGVSGWFGRNGTHQCRSRQQGCAVTRPTAGSMLESDATQANPTK